MSGAHRRKAAPININATLAATASPSPPPVSPVGTDLDGFVHGHKTLSLAAITCDDRAQVRVQPLDPATVDAYAEAMRDGAKFPPVIAFFDGKAHWLADGFHRVAAARKAGKREVPADIKEGGLDEAIIHAVGANDKHGLRRTRPDTRNAVRALLAHPKWRDCTDRWIADKVHVDHKTVGKFRKEIQAGEPVGEFPQLDDAGSDGVDSTPEGDPVPVESTSRPAVRTGKDGKKYPAKKAKPKAASKPGKAATPTTPTRGKATPASPPPEAAAGPLDLAPTSSPLVGEAPAGPAPFVTLWTSHARAALAAVLNHDRVRIARIMCIPEAHVTEADALWYLVEWACLNRGITPDREGEDEYTPPASRLERDITLPGESVGLVDKAGA